MQSVKALDNLKLKISWGLNGNQSLSPTVRFPRSMSESGGIVAFFDNQVAWDRTSRRSATQASAGRAPSRSTTDWRPTFSRGASISNLTHTYPRQPTRSSPETFRLWARVSCQRATMGRVDNWGIEANLTTENIRSNDFSWRTTLSFTMNRNKLVELYGDGRMTSPSRSSLENHSAPSTATNGSALSKRPIRTTWRQRLETGRRNVRKHRWKQ